MISDVFGEENNKRKKRGQNLFLLFFKKNINRFFRIIFDKRLLKSPDYVIALSLLFFLLVTIVFAPRITLGFFGIGSVRREEAVSEHGNGIVTYRGRKYPAMVAEKISEIEHSAVGRGEDMVIGRHLKLLRGLPWFDEVEENDDIDDVANYIQSSHFGMEKAKKSVIRSLALRRQMRISGRDISSCNTLCLAGGPGVGKSTLAAAIAEALHRPFFKINSSSLISRADLAGYPKAYRAAKEGAIISAIYHTQVKNPVILLDEIDKVSKNSSFDSQDVASVLLEVLDQRQNYMFVDRFLEVPFDLSGVLFIATANDVDAIPAPLLDRLEIVNINAYTNNEKKKIFKEYSLPRILYESGLKKGDIRFTDGAIEHLVKISSGESGMRSIERHTRNIIADVILKCGGDIKKINNAVVKKKDVKNIRSLSNEISSRGEEILDMTPGIGKVFYASVNGNGIGNISAVQAYIVPGKGEEILTGISFRSEIGEHRVNTDFLCQQAKKTRFFLTKNAGELGLSASKIKKSDIIFETPYYACGPSAGLAMTLQIYSALKQKPVKEKILCIGTMGLNGEALPVAGVYSKVLAGIQSGIKEIFVARCCLGCLDDIPEEEKKKVEIHPVDNVREILAVALKDK